MDALALLCTLHADGPATLKRLRAAGCQDLTRLLARPVTEVAVALDVPPAAARRLLREARLLAERVGPDLEDEEAPSVASVSAGAPVAGPTATPGPAPLRVEVPPVPQASVLDQGDRALLERIVREGRAAREAAPGPVAAVPAAAAAPEVPAAPAPDAVRAALPAPFARAADAALAGPESPLERLGVDLGAEAPWHGEPPAGYLGSELVGAAEAPTGAEPAAPDAPSAVEALVALGLAAALARDLERLGIDSVAALAEVDALALRRDLDVTFAEAKRLVFLAKRALREAGSKAPALQARAAERPLDRPAERTVELRPAARPEPPRAEAPPPAVAQPVVAPPAVSRPAAASSAAPVPAERAPEPPPAPAPRTPWRLTPRTEPLPPAPEPEPVAAVPARPRFWEPRAHLSASAQESQGIQVDPSEVARPRRFWEARRDAGSSAAGGPQGSDGAAVAPAGLPNRSAAPGGAAGTTSGSGTTSGTSSGTTLGWNFEIPRPELPPPSGPSRRTWRPAEPSDDSSAGPFA